MNCNVNCYFRSEQAEEYMADSTVHLIEEETENDYLVYANVAIFFNEKHAFILHKELIKTKNVLVIMPMFRHGPTEYCVIFPDGSVNMYCSSIEEAFRRFGKKNE